MFVSFERCICRIIFSPPLSFLLNLASYVVSFHFTLYAEYSKLRFTSFYLRRTIYRYQGHNQYAFSSIVEQVRSSKMVSLDVAHSWTLSTICVHIYAMFVQNHKRNAELLFFQEDERIREFGSIEISMNLYYMDPARLRSHPNSMINLAN